MSALQKKTDRKIVAVTRETRIDDLRRRFNSLDQIAFYLQARGSKVEDYLAEDATYKSALSAVKASLSPLGFVQFLDRSYLPNFVFGPEDTVVAIGQDGLVANTLKYLRDGQPLVGVNPDPARWDGVLLPFRVEDLSGIVMEIFEDRAARKEVSMAKVALNDGQEMLAVNDFFIGQRTHTSARYLIASGNREERHSSSGVIVSTGLGSTGWLKSLLHGARAVSASAGSRPDIGKSEGDESDPCRVDDPDLQLPWDTDRLFFTVREPFPSRWTQAGLVFGRIDRDTPFTIRSLMPENGVIFSDGIESDFLEFNSGAEAAVTVAEVRGRLVTG